jgi:heterodisulfide reductase subunit A
LEIPETKNLLMHAEDMTLGQPIEIEAEMVVLATAAIPKKGSEEIARILNLTRGADGFFMESHPKLKPLDAPTDGIFLGRGMPRLEGHTLQCFAGLRSSLTGGYRALQA